MKQRLTICVSGRVQGVMFRASAKKFADRLGLTGVARNLPDGSVEIVAEGDTPSLQSLFDWCYRGSFLARVDHLSFAWSEPAGTFRLFTVERSGGVIADELLAFKNLSRRALQISLPVVPRHLVIIPDGNRRWAKERRLPVWKGHERGLDRIHELLLAAKKRGIEFVTFWCFSTENWGRGKEEVKKLMALFSIALSRFEDKLKRERVQFRHFGRKDRFPKSLVAKLRALEETTKMYTDSHFGVALDYGGRDELMRAFTKLRDEGVPFTEETVARALDTDGFPDPDLIIRTSGERRISGIMPWQSVYAELYFTPVYFPDFDELQLHYALADYASRERRFGA